MDRDGDGDAAHHPAVPDRLLRRGGHHHERSASPSRARSHGRHPASGSHSAMTAGPTFQETASELMKRLETSEEGLSSEEAARRAQACGPNEMTTVHVGRRVLEVIRSILNPLVVILL